MIELAAHLNFGGKVKGIRRQNWVWDPDLRGQWSRPLMIFS